MICLKKLQRCHGVLTASEVFHHLGSSWRLTAFSQSTNYLRADKFHLAFTIRYLHKTVLWRSAIPKDSNNYHMSANYLSLPLCFDKIRYLTNEILNVLLETFCFRIALMTQSRLEMGFKNLYFKKFQMWASGEYAIVLVSCKLLVLC